MSLSHLPVNSWPFACDRGAGAKRVCDRVSMARCADRRAVSITVGSLRFASLRDAARHFGVPIATVRARISRRWSREDAVSIPMRKHTKH